MIESLYSEILKKAEKVFDIENTYPEILSVSVLPNAIENQKPYAFQAFVTYTSPKNRDLNLAEYLNYPKWSSKYSDKLDEEAELYAEGTTVEEALQYLLKSLTKLEEEKAKSVSYWLIKTKRTNEYFISHNKSSSDFTLIEWSSKQKEACKFSNYYDAEEVFLRLKKLGYDIKIYKITPKQKDKSQDDAVKCTLAHPKIGTVFTEDIVTYIVTNFEKTEQEEERVFVTRSGWYNKSNSWGTLKKYWEAKNTGKIKVIYEPKS